MQNVPLDDANNRYVDLFKLRFKNIYKIFINIYKLKKMHINRGQNGSPTYCKLTYTEGCSGRALKIKIKTKVKR